MNGGTKTEQGPETSLLRKMPWVGHVAFGVVYAALFFFVCAIKPAPQQWMRASIAIQASEEEVARLMEGAAPIRSLPVKHVGVMLLTKQQGTNVSVSPSLNSVVLTVDAHWQVRGGMVGQLVDQVIGRPARAEALEESLESLKTQAEAGHAGL